MLTSALLDAIGRAIQEAKHHHAGRGEPLDGPGNLPGGLAHALAEVERLTTGHYLPKTVRPPYQTKGTGYDGGPSLETTTVPAGDDEDPT